MKLERLAQAAGIAIDGAGSIEVTGFAIDHRKVAPGTVFGAFRGTKFNAEDVIGAAIEAGAVAVVASHKAKVEGVVHIAADQPRRIFALLAAQFFAPMPPVIAAITGTNGKTSTVEMVRQIWRMCGERAASIGTLGVTTPDESVSTGLTTPDIVTFLSNLSGLAREGVTHVAYEASSHGLAQFRNEGAALAACGFTNFSRDHLDYHGDMESYFAAKMRLFDEVAGANIPAVIWSGGDECEWTRRAIERAHKRQLRVLTVGERGDFLRLAARLPTRTGQEIEINHKGKDYRLILPLIGAYQAANALVAGGIAIATGCEPAQVFDAISRIQPVRGRLERAAITHKGAPVYVDYAHTPDALAEAIKALRAHTKGRLLCVFGAGGDRDQGKRAPMGEIASALADHVIVTDDNPRGEDPAEIRRQILAAAGDNAREIGSRREAIAAAIESAGGDDIILIAGKGHETGQIIGAGESLKILPFDDVAVAAQEAARIGQQAWEKSE